MISSMASRQGRRLTLAAPSSSRKFLQRRLFSFDEFPTPQTTPPPTMQNTAMATALFGFVGGVFFYSMNMVGRSGPESDPLAQLKAEAQEARQNKKGDQQERMTKEEIDALESGMTGGGGEDGDGGKLRVAVAAPADIAQLEEEANLNIFRQKQDGGEEPKKKKGWWRFGF
jgi:hypothetical protein